MNLSFFLHLNLDSLRICLPQHDKLFGLGLVVKQYALSVKAKPEVSRYWNNMLYQWRQNQNYLVDVLTRLSLVNWLSLSFGQFVPFVSFGYFVSFMVHMFLLCICVLLRLLPSLEFSLCPFQFGFCPVCVFYCLCFSLGFAQFVFFIVWVVVRVLPSLCPLLFVFLSVWSCLCFCFGPGFAFVVWISNRVAQGDNFLFLFVCLVLNSFFSPPCWYIKFHFYTCINLRF